MDSILGKFSISDFFSLICSGAIFQFGLKSMGICTDKILKAIYSMDFLFLTNDHTATVIMFFAVELGICYITGSCIQELGECLQENFFQIKKKRQPPVFTAMV